MNANFLVSPHAGARVPGARRLFVTNPYVAHVLERNGEIASYEEVAVSAPLRDTRETFLTDHEFVDRKFHQYTSIFSQRLSEIHGGRYRHDFWRKALSTALLRHIALCYEMFQVCEARLRPESHVCRVLSEPSYYVPRDFNEHRRFFQNSDYGQEQLFSVYCGMFHPGRFGEWHGKHEWPKLPPAPPPRRRRPIADLPRRVARRFLRMREPSVAIMNSYFSEENLDRLLFRSLGRIQPISIPAVASSPAPLDWEKRDALTRAEVQSDRFDRFALAALRHGMPRAFVEDAPLLLSTYEAAFSRHPGLRWAVCEAWIGDMYSATALAVLGVRGVRHLYNEHNYIAHPFLGNNLKYLIPLADAFATLGWKSPVYPTAVPGASLFKWTDSLPLPGGEDILYVASLPQVRAPEVNASYGESGPVNVPRYFAFVERFLSALSGACAAQVVMRAYPTSPRRTLMAWDFKYRLREQLPRLKRVDDSEIGARTLMRKAKLVIVDYFSTSFIETMLADVPTVLLWNRDTRYTLDAHADFFDGLIGAGICQVDPAAAAAFVERIKDDPAAWWRRPEVRCARENFLSANIGQPQVLIEQLLRLAGPPPRRGAQVSNSFTGEKTC